MRGDKRRRLSKIEEVQAAELELEREHWLESLSEDQREFFLTDLLARLAKDGLAPELAGALSDLSSEDEDDLFALAGKMQKRDPALAARHHSAAILATVNTWPSTWPGIERWLI
jgi:hypothetical protein